MRAFVALRFPPAVRGALAALQRMLAESGGDVKWVEPDHLHITLKFLGEITPTQQQAIEAMLRRLVAQTPRFDVSLKEVGAFPTLDAPRVIWVGISEGRETVMRIAEAIEREGREIPLQKEERPFAAHVTLGRVRSAARRQALTEQLRAIRWEPPTSWSATTLTLYRSILSAAGPEYTVLADLSFPAPTS